MNTSKTMCKGLTLTLVLLLSITGSLQSESGKSESIVFISPITINQTASLKCLKGRRLNLMQIIINLWLRHFLFDEFVNVPSVDNTR